MNIEMEEQEKEVEKIMEQIKENIEQKKALGVYSDEEIEWVKRMDGKIASSKGPGNHGFQEQLGQMNLNWDLKNKIPITSHRRILGSLLVLSKKTMRKLTKSYINLVLGEQVEFNSCVTRVINQLAGKLTGLEEGYNNLAKRHQELFDKVDTWNAEVRQNHAQLRLEHNQLFDKVDQWNAELNRNHAQLNENHQILSDKVNLWNAEVRQNHAQLRLEHNQLFDKVDQWNAETRKQQAELEQNHQSLFEKVDQWNEDLRKELAQLKDRHIGLYHKYTAVQQENTLLKRRLDIILSDLHNKSSQGPESAYNLIKHQERLMDHAYFLFEHSYRGLPQEIRERFKVYLPYLSGVSDILDVGCGRGEFLDLMKDHGITAKGIDISDDMVYYCQERGLTVEQKEAQDYLTSLPDFSLGGIFAAQLLEHLPTTSLQEFIKLCYQKMRPGGMFIAETINPLSLISAIRNFYLDPSHVKPLHPEALRFLLESFGFKEVQILFLSPFPQELTLQKLIPEDDLQKEYQELTDLMNRNIDQLNEVLYGYQDYAIIAKRG
jgi:O-antigen chain-terminating methyltransferase